MQGTRGGGKGQQSLHGRQRRSAAEGGWPCWSGLASVPRAEAATPLLLSQDPGDDDLKGEQPGDGQSIHPQGDCMSVGRNDIMEGAPTELGERKVQLSPPRCRPRTNGSIFAYASDDIAPAANIAPSPTAALLDLRVSHLR